MLSLPIIILITIQSFLKIANANWAVTSYVGATLIISYYVTLKKNNILRMFFYLGLLLNITLSIYILNISISGSFYPVDLKSNPLRKNLGFENLAIKIHDIFIEEKISKIVFENRGDITRFNYYLNRNNNNFNGKIFIKSSNLTPKNYYQKKFNYDLAFKTSGEKILIVKNIYDFKNDNYNIDEIKFLKSISTKTVKNLEKTYYLYVGKTK